MRFLPSDDQKVIAEAVRDMLAKECSSATLRESWGARPSPRIRDCLAEAGVFGLVVAEQYGGLGMDERDAFGVLIETGRAAVPGPIAETFAAVHVLQRAGNAHLAEMWLPKIAAGEATVTIGLGSAPLVESADAADLLILEHAGSLYAVPRVGISVASQESIDRNRRLFSLEWSPAAGTKLGEQGCAQLLVTAMRDQLLFAVSAQLIGLSRQLLDLSVQHVAVRTQFGQPLGALQAVQHRLADVAVAVEFASPVVARAACSLTEGVASSTRDVAMAKVFASDAAERAAYSALQVHGALGYTREHDLHLYALRAWALALAHGNAQVHRARVADELLGVVPSAPMYP